MPDAQWYAFYREADGTLVTVADEVPEPLPEGIAIAPCDPPWLQQALWDPAAHAFVPAGDPASDAAATDGSDGDDAPDGLNQALNLLNHLEAGRRLSKGDVVAIRLVVDTWPNALTVATKAMTAYIDAHPELVEAYLAERSGNPALTYVPAGSGLTAADFGAVHSSAPAHPCPQDGDVSCHCADGCEAMRAAQGGSDA